MLLLEEVEDEAILDNVSAARRYWKQQRDLKDPLDYRDFAASSPEVVAAVVRRLHVPSARRIETIRYPKKALVGDRQMSVLDPYDQLALRLAVGCCIPSIEESLAEQVLHVRTKTQGASWQTLPFFDANRERRSRRIKNYHAGFHSAGAVDVQNHYATVGEDPLRRVLQSILAPQLRIEELLDLLASFRLRGAGPGLPIGPEAAAPLGTVSLLPIDRLLARLGIVFVRYADDIDIYVNDQTVFNELVEHVEALLRSSEQCLNPSKTKFLVGFEFLFSLFESGTPSLADDVEDASGELDALLEADELGRVAGMLRTLGKEGKSWAAETVLQDPRYVDRLPQPSAAYLSKVSSQLPTALFDEVKLRIVESARAANTASVMHLAGVLDRKSVGSADATTLIEVGLRAEVGSPLAAAHLLSAAGRSDEPSGKKHRRALEIATETDDLMIQRTMIGHLYRSGGLSNLAKAGLHKLSSVPELAPTVAWALSA